MKVMIVDDSAAMRMMVLRTLRQAGFDSHDYEQAEDGAKALEAISDNQPDLVLCDWNMPNMNGIELLQALTSRDINVPFGFITTESTAEMKAKAKDAGASFVITKPFTAESFQQTLSGILG